jgi:hypothetical protein
VARWVDLACIVGEFPLDDASHRERLTAAIKGVDVGRLIESLEDPRGVFVPLHFICSQLANVDGLDPVETMLDATRALVAKWPADSDLGDDLWLLFECFAVVSKAGTPASSARRMAELMRRVLTIWPAIAPMMRTMVQALCDRLPLEESKELWALMTHLRATA